MEHIEERIHSELAKATSQTCKCGHKYRYHLQDVNSQKYVCRGAYCKCNNFIPDEAM